MQHRRTGRLWQSLILGKFNPLFEYLPIENMVFKHQQEYYEAIAASTKAGESGPFIDFMLNEILDSLRNHINKEKIPNKVSNKVPNKIPNKSQKLILDLLSQDPHFTRSQLADKSGLSEASVKKILTQLKSDGWVERIGSNKTGYWAVHYKA